MSFEEELEIDIKERLEPLATLHGVEVVDFPINKSGIQPTVIKPRIMPIFAGEKAGEERSTDQVQQEVDVMVNVWVSARERHGINGLYFCKEKMEEFLLGYIPKGCIRKLIQVDGQFPDLETDNWIYVVTFKTSRLKVQFDDSESGPLLLISTFNENIS